MALYWYRTSRHPMEGGQGRQDVKGGAVNVTVLDGGKALADVLQVDADKPTPLYLQLCARLRESLDRGLLKTGDAVPGERDLARLAGISRVTVRRAIDELVAEGLLIQRQGAGTFVAKRVEQPLSVLSSFSEDMRARGLRPGSIWIERATDRPMPEEAMALDLSPGDRVVRLARVRTADDRPMAIERATVPARFLADADQVGHSLYEALRQHGHSAVRALQRLRAVVLSDNDATLLAVPSGGAALYIERRAFLADGTPLEFTRSLYRSDLYDFVAELRVDT